MSNSFNVSDSEFFFDYKLTPQKEIMRFKKFLEISGVPTEKFRVQMNNAGKELGIVFDTAGTEFSVKSDMDYSQDECGDMFASLIVHGRSWSLMYKNTAYAKQDVSYEHTGRERFSSLKLNFKVFQKIEESIAEMRNKACVIYKASSNASFQNPLCFFAKIPYELKLNILAMTGDKKFFNAEQSMKMARGFFSRPFSYNITPPLQLTAKPDDNKTTSSVV